MRFLKGVRFGRNRKNRENSLIKLVLQYSLSSLAFLNAPNLPLNIIKLKYMNNLIPTLVLSAMLASGSAPSVLDVRVATKSPEATYSQSDQLPLPNIKGVSTGSPLKVISGHRTTSSTKSAAAPVAPKPTPLAANKPLGISAPAATVPQPVKSPTPPITTPVVDPASANTAAAVINASNAARSQNGSLPPLIENATLNKVAETKLNDMFEKQYYAHRSPQGIMPWNIARALGYSYTVFGENLIMGSNMTGQSMVDGWMASPGHKANILSPRYKEIGVAVKEGFYYGRKVWLGVQEFGTSR